MHNQECGQNKETQVRSCNKILVQTPNPIVQIAAIIKSQTKHLTKDSLSIEKKKTKSKQQHTIWNDTLSFPINSYNFKFQTFACIGNFLYPFSHSFLF